MNTVSQEMKTIFKIPKDHNKICAPFFELNKKMPFPQPGGALGWANE